MVDQDLLLINLMNQPIYTLIILDACRYDSFKDWNSIQGDLLPADSCAGHTYVWLLNTFPGKYPDVTVFSAHPVINSSGITPANFVPSVNRHTFDTSTTWHSTEHFSPDNIKDIWKTIGSKYHYTHDSAHRLDPKIPGPGFNVTKASRITSMIDIILKEGLSHKNIIWIMSPHPPFIANPGNIVDAYEHTLRFTLNQVKRLSPILTKNTVITSDHGESFRLISETKLPKNFPRGKRKFVGHEPGLPFPELYEVPWFIWR